MFPIYFRENKKEFKNRSNNQCWCLRYTMCKQWLRSKLNVEIITKSIFLNVLEYQLMTKPLYNYLSEIMVQEKYI